jgi:hypothetical protein
LRERAKVAMHVANIEVLIDVLLPVLGASILLVLSRTGPKVRAEKSGVTVLVSRVRVFLAQDVNVSGIRVRRKFRSNCLIRLRKGSFACAVLSISDASAN